MYWKSRKLPANELVKATAEHAVQEFSAEFRGPEQIKFRVLHERADFVQTYGSNADPAMQTWQGMMAAHLPSSGAIHASTDR